MANGRKGHYNIAKVKRFKALGIGIRKRNIPLIARSLGFRGFGTGVRRLLTPQTSEARRQLRGRTVTRRRRR